MNRSDDNTVIILAITSGLLFVAIGIFVIFTHGSVVTLLCDRSNENTRYCELQTRRILNSELKRFPVDELKFATIKAFPEIKNFKAYAHSVIIKTIDQEIKFNPVPTPGIEEKFIIINNINNYITNKNIVKLKIKDDDRAKSYLTGSIFIISGILLAIIITFLRKLEQRILRGD